MAGESVERVEQLCVPRVESDLGVLSARLDQCTLSVTRQHQFGGGSTAGRKVARPACR